jgi:hypothetical protein
MVASQDSMSKLTDLVVKYVPPDRLREFAEELSLVDGNASVRNTVMGVAKRIKQRLKPI